MKPPGAKYVALPSWDGQQWQVRVEDYDDVHRGDTTARRLDEVPDSVRVLLVDQLMCFMPELPVWVDPQLPEGIEHALQTAEGHRTVAARHVDAVVSALQQANMFGHDIAALLTERSLQHLPQRPLLIPNTEIATHGLNRHPDVIAVEWTDGNDILVCCRACVEQKPQAYQAEADRSSAAIYDRPGRCDICGRNEPEATLRETDRQRPGEEH